MCSFVGSRFSKNTAFSKRSFKLSVFEKTQKSHFAPKIDKIDPNFSPHGIYIYLIHFLNLKPYSEASYSPKMAYFSPLNCIRENGQKR